MPVFGGEMQAWMIDHYGWFVAIGLIFEAYRFGEWNGERRVRNEWFKERLAAMCDRGAKG